MRVEVEIDSSAGPVRVILTGADNGSVWGKFVFGRLKSKPGVRALVFDSRAEFHKDIAASHGVVVSGGGWMEFDQTNLRARVGGRSTQFGRETDRRLTLELLGKALPGFHLEDVT